MRFRIAFKQAWNLITTNRTIAALLPVGIFGQLLSSLSKNAFAVTKLQSFFLPVACIGVLLWLVLALYIPSLYYAGLYLGIAKLERQESLPGVVELLREAHGFVGRLIGLSIVLSIMLGAPVVIFFGLLAIIARLGSPVGIGGDPQLLLYPAFILIIPIINFAKIALVVEDRSVDDAARRAWAIFKSAFWRVLVTIFLLVIVQYSIAWAAQFLVSATEIYWLGVMPAIPATLLTNQPSTYLGQLIVLVVVGITDYFYVILLTRYFFHLAKQMPGQPPAAEPLPESL